MSTPSSADASDVANHPAGLGMIWAQDADGGIGLDGDMPWYLPEDMAHFRSSTRGLPVLMGRIQWESLEPKFRPLPGRENIVLTRDAHYEAPGAQVVSDLRQALALVADRWAWVIGGGQIYRQAMPFADELLVTTIDETFATDVSAPEIGSEWHAAERTPATGWTESKTGTRFAITRFTRRSIKK